MRLVMGLVLWERRGIGDGREVPWSLALGTPRTRPCPLVYLASLGGAPLGLDVPGCFGGEGPFPPSLYLIFC